MMAYLVKRMTAVVTVFVAMMTLACSNEPVSTPESNSSGPTADAGTGGAGASSPVKPSLEPHARIAPNSPQSTILPKPVKPTKLKRSMLPEVKLSAGHASLCTVNTDDAMPPIELPDLAGNQQDLSKLYGKNLTVVFFWKGDRALARAELADLESDVVKRYGKKGVNVIGIAVDETAETAEKYVSEAGVTYPNLLDADGSAMSMVGTEKLPRTYLLDAAGDILWFDIEYSRATRRELRKAIRAVLRQIPQG